MGSPPCALMSRTAWMSRMAASPRFTMAMRLNTPPSLPHRTGYQPVTSAPRWVRWTDGPPRYTVGGMRQLTSLDAQFLAMESARQYGHVGGLAVLDPSTRGGALDLASVQQLIEQRLPLVPPLRWRLAEVPFNLDYSYWVDDPDFDLEFHVREIALPAPGNEAQLADQVARIVARPLDRARPLWELYLIQGLEDGHVAVLTKIHHAVVDGLSGAEIMAALLDLTPEGREVPPASGPVDRMPSSSEMLLRGMVGALKFPVRFARSAPAALPNLAEVRSLAVVPGIATVSEVLKRTREVALRRP